MHTYTDVLDCARYFLVNIFLSNLSRSRLVERSTIQYTRTSSNPLPKPAVEIEEDRLLLINFSPPTRFPPRLGNPRKAS